MTTFYKQEQVSGTAYRRCRAINIYNPLTGVPTVNFDEENALVMSSGKAVPLPNDLSSAPMSMSFGVSVNDLTKAIPILDPQTLQPTGQQMTYGEIHAVLLSAYIAEATARDAAQNTNP